MKNFLYTGAILAASVTGTLADLCSEGSTEDGGNWYCQKVKGITYTGLDGSGSYQKVTSVDPNTGNCEFASQSYGGSMAPLDEGVCGVHFPSLALPCADNHPSCPGTSAVPSL